MGLGFVESIALLNTQGPSQQHQSSKSYVVYKLDWCGLIEGLGVHLR